MSADIPALFARARAGGELVVLEGLHAVKHALRFGAEVEHLVTPDREALLVLAHELAPDLVDAFTGAREVTRELFDRLPARTPASPVLAIARTRRAEVRPGPGPVVALYDPRHAGNVGACIRVAAAAGAAAVVVIGDLDPWGAPVVRAAAGLNWALDVGRSDWPLPFGRPIIAYDADEAGAEAPPIDSADALHLFGSERHGLPSDVLAAADEVRRIPMRAGVSSLNLATSVAIALYGS